MRDHGFHPLRVGRVIRETADASSFILDVPAELRDAFVYDAGQFVTFRVCHNGQQLLRCYSMSSSPVVDTELKVTVKRVPGGVVSNWMIDTLAPGDLLDVTSPAGVFCLGSGRADIVAFGAGSGITPLLSIVKTALATTARGVRLLYANRDRDAVIFGAALQALSEEYPDRLEVVHHLDVEQGFVDDEVVRGFTDFGTGADYYICGPGPFMDIVESTLLGHGVDAARIHIERFTVEDQTAASDTTAAPADGRITIEVDGRSETADHRPGTTILQMARQIGMAPPYSCESGSCATCMAKVVEGAATMRVNNALTDDEVADGWVLTCQAVPATPSLRVVYGYEED
ncbi:MAG: 2Fe-2S iron-sulfur cluster-binding protein [Acidimicrobiales bacterium]